MQNSERSKRNRLFFMQVVTTNCCENFLENWFSLFFFALFLSLCARSVRFFPARECLRMTISATSSDWSVMNEWRHTLGVSRQWVRTDGDSIMLQNWAICLSISVVLLLLLAAFFLLQFKFSLFCASFSGFSRSLHYRLFLQLFSPHAVNRVGMITSVSSLISFLVFLLDLLLSSLLFPSSASFLPLRRCSSFLLSFPFFLWSFLSSPLLSFRSLPFSPLAPAPLFSLQLLISSPPSLFSLFLSLSLPLFVIFWHEMLAL